jgi:hypothetical protein
VILALILVVLLTPVWRAVRARSKGAPHKGVKST